MASTNDVILIGVLVFIFAIGFFVLLGIVVNRGSLGSAETCEVDLVAGNQPVKTVQAPSPALTAGNTKIALVEITSDDHIKGNVNAPITIVEFSDPECPYCKRFHDTMQQVVANYGDSVRWVYKHAPLDGLHRKARKEAEAMECAYEQKGNDGFWKFADRLYEITPSNDRLEVSQLPEIAKYVGLDVNKFNTCLDSGEFASKVQGQLDEAQKAGLRGTPYSVIIAGDQTIPVSGAYPFEQIKAMIDPLLK